jgi:PhnB protein
MAAVTLDPYIFFNGNCREAMEFYQGILDGELALQTYKDVGMGDADQADKLMHAALKGGVATLYGSDTEKASDKAAKISLCLGGEDEAELTKIFEGLSEGAEVRQPLKKEFWGDTFGSLVDKYGVEWMVNIAAPKPA